MIRSTTGPLVLPGPLHRRVEAALTSHFGPGSLVEDFAQPAGEPALCAPDSVSWRLFKNPVTLFVGGVAAVILELAEPRVRSGVWDHTTFRTRPLERMQRTARAAVMTVYGPRSRAEALIARVRRLHGQVRGTTPQGLPYRADDPELLAWVHATAVFGFVQAHATYVRPLAPSERDRCYAEGQPAAALYGAATVPATQAALDAWFGAMRERLGPSEVVDEFLRIVAAMPALPAPLRPMQALLVRAAVALVPPDLRARLALQRHAPLTPWQHAVVCHTAQAADRLLLHGGPAVLSCLRLGLPADWLYRTA